MTNDKRLAKTGDPAVDRALSILSNAPQNGPAQISTGSGIAIAGAWIAGGAVTIVMLLIVFVFDSAPETQQEDIKPWDTLVLFLLIAAPLISAYSIAKVILSKD